VYSPCNSRSNSPGYLFYTFFSLIQPPIPPPPSDIQLRFTIPAFWSILKPKEENLHTLETSYVPACQHHIICLRSAAQGLCASLFTPALHLIPFCFLRDMALANLFPFFYTVILLPSVATTNINTCCFFF
jgi:hypothetical protein